MTDLNLNFKEYSQPKRLHYQKDEEKNDWLQMLFDSYFIADKGIYEGIKQQTTNNKQLACAKGCSNCCKTHISIPIYPLEIIGLYWYCVEKIKDDNKQTLINQLRDFSKGKVCPFLINDICSIHEMRPLACRHFIVFDKVCDVGEDAYYTRRDDVLTPIKKNQEDALAALLPFHNVKQKSKQRKAMKDGLIHNLAQDMQEIEWKKLADRMESGQFSKE